jgi:hypothetical protein
LPPPPHTAIPHSVSASVLYRRDIDYSQINIAASDYHRSSPRTEAKIDDGTHSSLDSLPPASSLPVRGLDGTPSLNSSTTLLASTVPCPSLTVLNGLTLPSQQMAEQLPGRVQFLARDQTGCRFLQKCLEEKDPEIFSIIFSQVLLNINELMTGLILRIRSSSSFLFPSLLFSYPSLLFCIFLVVMRRRSLWKLFGGMLACFLYFELLVSLFFRLLFSKNSWNYVTTSSASPFCKRFTQISLQSA